MKRFLAVLEHARLALTAAVLLVATACSPSDATPRDTIPVYRLVAQQGTMVRFIMVSPTIAADDSALLRIADSFLPNMAGRAVMLQVWTDEGMVPARVETMSDMQLAARKAVVTVNLNTGFRKVER